MTSLTSLVTCALLIGCLTGKVHSSPDKSKLFNDLMSSYNEYILPSQDGSKLDVRISLMLYNLIDVDEKSNSIDLIAWLSMYWVDYRLGWNPDSYGGITQMALPMNLLWKPDVVLYNGLFEGSDRSGIGASVDTMAVVSHDGQVAWVPPTRVKATCSIDMTDFPNDSQICYLKYGSWVYTGQELDLLITPDLGVDISDYVQSNEWQLTSTTAVRNEAMYPCCPETYPNVVFTLNLRRRQSANPNAAMLPPTCVAEWYRTWQSAGCPN